MATNFDDFRLAVEALSGGKNTVKLDDLGMPSVMVPLPALTYADVMTGGTADKLPGFLIENAERKMYVSKFLNIIVNNRAYSLPMKDPRASINFDAALAACRTKGEGWGLNTAGLWAAIMSWCYKNNTIPRGNTNYGAAHDAAHEKGIGTHMADATRVGRTATGSGPATWYHDLTTTGIADLVGNVWEWTAGLRLVNGEIQIIPYSDALKSSVNLGAASTDWKAIMPNGSLVAPGTAGTLKYDGETAGGGIRINTEIEFTTDAMGVDKYTTKAFGSIAAKSGVSIPQIMYGLGLAPISGYSYQGLMYLRNHEAERLPSRGGSFSSTSYAGLGALRLDDPRSNVSADIGFRSAFYE